MKKGSISVIIALILGIVAIVVILGVFGQPLYKYVKGLFGEEGLFGTRTEESPIPGTVSGTGLPFKQLMGPKLALPAIISDELVSCWNSMTQGNIDRLKCSQVCICLDKPCECIEAKKAEDIQNKLLVARLHFIDDPRAIGVTVQGSDLYNEVHLLGSLEAADALKNSWARSHPYSIRVGLYEGVLYMVCADHNSITANSLFITENLQFNCE